MDYAGLQYHMQSLQGNFMLPFSSPSIIGA
jgi:hypothetical protein